MISGYNVEKIHEQKAREFEKRAAQNRLVKIARANQPSIWHRVQARWANIVKLLQIHHDNQVSAIRETGVFPVQQKLQTEENFSV